MRILFYTAVAITAGWVGLAHAEDTKQSGPGTTGQMNKVAPAGVATDPGGVKAQQGNTKSSPGTVGAAPSADTKSQTGK